MQAYTRKPCCGRETAQCRCKLQYVLKFTVASRSPPCDSTASCFYINRTNCVLFMNQLLIHITTHLVDLVVVLLLVRATAFKKAWGCFDSVMWTMQKAKKFTPVISPSATFPKSFLLGAPGLKQWSKIEIVEEVVNSFLCMSGGCSCCISRVINIWRWTSGYQLFWRRMQCEFRWTHLVMKVHGSTFSHSTSYDRPETPYVLTSPSLIAGPCAQMCRWFILMK